MLNQKFLKTTAVIFLLLIAIVFLGLYAYNISQQQKLRMPEKVYRDLTESEMKIVEQSIKNAKQRQQHRSNQQNLVSEIPERPERSDDVESKSNEDLSQSQVSIKENLDNPIIETLIKNGPVTDFGHLMPTRGNPTFETNSFEELQNYISKLENSDNPKHRRTAQELRNSLSRMNPPENTENVIFSISVED